MTVSLPTLCSRVSMPRIFPVTGVGNSTVDASPRTCRSRSPIEGSRVRSTEKVLQRLGDRIARAVGDGRDSSAPLIFEHHALEQIVDVGDVEFQIDVGVARNFARVLEESDAGSEQHNAGQRQRGRFVVGLGCQRACAGGQRCQPGAKQYAAQGVNRIAMTGPSFSLEVNSKDGKRESVPDSRAGLNTRRR